MTINIEELESSICDFSPDCVLMVLADDYYDKSDYIREYDKFLEEVNQ